MTGLLSSLDPLLSVFASPAWRQVLWTLAHGLWQGVVVALVLAGLLMRLPANRPQRRYWAAVLALAGVVVASIVTWSILDLVPLVNGKASENLSAKTIPHGDGTLDFHGNRNDAADVAIPLSPGPGDPNLALGSEGFRWHAFFAAAWVFGATLMMVRVAAMVTGARRMVLGRPTDDARVLQVVERLRVRFHIRRRIEVIPFDGFGPAVVGVLRPVLLLPASMLTGMPLDGIEAIVAHELAHVRRHDYLANLLQLLVEAALFFNPAVWWISRQIRREREACCDALAVEATGEPVAYLQAIADWLEQSRGMSRAATMAALAIEGDGNVLERVRRLLNRGYRPELRASWLALASSLLVSTVALLLLWQGARISVAYAVSLLTPAERIDELDNQREELRPLPAEGAGDVTLSGTVSTRDGRPVPKYLDATLRSWNERESYQRSVHIAPPSFSIKASFGRIRLAVFAKGYAPVVIGPLETRPGETIDGLAVVFDAGFSSRLFVVNGNGDPVANCEVRGFLHGIGSVWKGNEFGEVVVEHASSHAYDLTIQAPGYQTLRLTDVTLEADQTKEVVLKQALPSAGVVVNPEGLPIAGATIRRACQIGPGNLGLMDGGNGALLATTSSDGRFILDSLNDEAIYGLLVETQDHGRRLFKGVAANQRDLRFVVGPDFVLNGRIHGDLKKLGTRGGEPMVSYSQPISFQGEPNFSSSFSLNGQAFVESDGRFHANNLLPGRLLLNAGDRTIEMEIENQVNEIVVDMDEILEGPPLRKVVLRFATPDSGIWPTGQVWIASNDKSHPQRDAYETMEKGMVTFDAYAPGMLSYSPKNVVGYWFEGGAFFVPPGSTKFVYEIRTVPAGAIRGKVGNPDGTIAADSVHVGVRSIDLPSEVQREQMSINNFPVDAWGRFFVSPLPLGGKYVVHARRGYENAVSNPVTVDDARISPTVHLQFNLTAGASGQVLDADGRPFSAAIIQLDFDHPNASTVYGPSRRTDSEGRFTFDRLTLGLGQYRVRVTTPDARTITVSLNPGGAPIVITLPR